MSNVICPVTMDELKSALGMTTPLSKFLAGGTDLIVTMRQSRLEPDTIVDLSSIDALRFIEHDNSVIRIGALTTFSELEKNKLLQKHAFCLANAASQIGSVQIRNMGTLGGNIAHASPAGDCITPLAMLDATAVIMDKNGDRSEKKVCDLILSPNKTSLAHDEVIIEFKFKALDTTYQSNFIKIGSRSTVTISKINIALACKLKQNLIEDIKIALGAVGIKPFRDYETEQKFKGKMVNDNFDCMFASEIRKRVEASIPGRNSLNYKRHAVEGMAIDILHKILAP
ncbi:MAG: FAD binding domain-containing protein [Desulfobacterium sp.]